MGRSPRAAAQGARHLAGLELGRLFQRGAGHRARDGRCRAAGRRGGLQVQADPRVIAAYLGT
ncbi:hypothetical protein [Variovorax sp. LjRoot178]|uniref:ABC transporter ATP-binding protein C-terminal domain-containing protein n=1 Tax=Variovorax sp. LjRoot178 TaxID=3342277 RepID=UPI003F515D95